MPRVYTLGPGRPGFAPPASEDAISTRICQVVSDDPGAFGVPGLVGGDLDLLLLVVLDGLLEADLVGQLRRPDVLLGEGVPVIL
jgi:hypothetical protein